MNCPNCNQPAEYRLGKTLCLNPDCPVYVIGTCCE